jgi:hypothetical protein
MVALARPQVADLKRLNFTAHIKGCGLVAALKQRPIKAIIAGAVSLVRRLCRNWTSGLIDYRAALGGDVIVRPGLCQPVEDIDLAADTCRMATTPKPAAWSINTGVGPQHGCATGRAADPARSKRRLGKKSGPGPLCRVSGSRDPTHGTK